MRYPFLIVLLAFYGTGWSQVARPAANPSACVYAGKARFTVLTPELIRMEWSRAGFTDSASQVFLNRYMPVPPFTSKLSGGRLLLQTGRLSLEYLVSVDSFSYNNLLVRSLDPALPFEWLPGLEDSFNLKGTMRTLDGKDGGDLSMLEDGILSRSGWALVNDSKTYLLGKDGWLLDRQDSLGQDWYFFGYGHEYKKALLDFTRVAGKIPLPPRYAFGYWWSRYWIYGENEMKELVTTFKELGVPMDVMIIDMDWHDTYKFRGNAGVPDGQGSLVGWTGYTWNRNIFPEPKKLLQWMEVRHIKNALNLHPSSGISPMEEKYSAFAKAYHFDTTGKRYIPYYGSDKKWAAIYFDSVLHPLEKQGVDFWWLDWQQYSFDRLKPGLSNTWWLNHLFFTDMQKQGKRPLLFHRWGGLGNHRYQVGFSGDTYTTWKTLAFQPAFTATAANVGYGYWSHDIGGHQISPVHPGDINDGELFLRWMQFGVFSPVLRTHSTKKAAIDRRFWNFKNEFRDIVDLVNLRYRLAPYIYSAAHSTTETGVALCHPLYYEYPGKIEAYAFNQSYYFGEKMIVSPVTVKTDSLNFLAQQQLWLPEGEWEEWLTGTPLSGNKIYDRGFSKSEIPLYVMSGSIIPMYPEGIKNLQEVENTIELAVFRGNGEGELYLDDGMSNDYLSGRYRKTKYTQKVEGSNTTLTIFPSKSDIILPQAMQYVIRLNRGLPPQRVIVNGKLYSYQPIAHAGSWTYLGETLETVITLPAVSATKKINVIIEGDKEWNSYIQYTAGYRGFVGRLKVAMEKIKFEISAVDWGAAIPDELLYEESLPVRINYEPGKTKQLLLENRKNVHNLRQVIMRIPDADKKNLQKICDYLMLPSE